MMHLLLWLAFIGTAYGGDCSTKDYRRELGANRNQDDLSWCFAYTSADLISQRIGRRVSATDLASTFILADATKLLESRDPEIQGYLRENPDFADLITKTRNFEKLDYSPEGLLTEKGMKDTGGAEDVTIMLANTKGYCPESNFPSREKVQDKFFHDVRKLLYRRYRADRLKFCSDLPEAWDPTSAVIDPVSRAIAKLYEEELDKKCRRQPLPAPLIPVMKKYADSLPEYRALIEKGQVKRGESEKALLDSLDQALDNHRVAAIGYSANLIMKPEPGDKDQHGDHSSTIVGRKKIGGSCHYLIRNTWGESCSIYLPKFRRRCEAGNVWVSGDELKDSLYSVIYLK
jgi:hypothetical protein